MNRIRKRFKSLVSTDSTTSPYNKGTSKFPRLQIYFYLFLVAPDGIEPSPLACKTSIPPSYAGAI